jgi:Sporulation delaying protein SdpA
MAVGRRHNDTSEDLAGSRRGFAFTACLIAVLLVASSTQLVPERLLSRSLSDERSAMAPIWPQGWSFFADEPVDNAAVVFSVDPSGHLGTLSQLEMTSKMDWGIDRSASAEFVEAETLIAQVPASSWLSCGDRAPDDCKAASVDTTPYFGVNNFSNPTFCGHLLLAIESPAQWTGRRAEWLQDWKIISVANSDFRCIG